MPKPNQARTSLFVKFVPVVLFFFICWALLLFAVQNQEPIEVDDSVQTRPAGHAVNVTEGELYQEELDGLARDWAALKQQVASVRARMAASASDLKRQVTEAEELRLDTGAVIGARLAPERERRSHGRYGREREAPEDVVDNVIHGPGLLRRPVLKAPLNTHKDTVSRDEFQELYRRYEETQMLLFGRADAGEPMAKTHKPKMVGVMKEIEEACQGMELDGYIWGTSRYEMLLRMAAQPWVQTVCETGFNIGSSAYVFLSQPHIEHVYSFDMIGADDSPQAKCKQNAIAVLQKHFPGRLTVTAGDSRESLPKFVDGHKGKVSCDLVHIDGGHAGDVPWSDLSHTHSISSADTLVVMDDMGKTPGDLSDKKAVCPYCVDTTKAWRRAISDNMVRPLTCVQTCLTGDAQERLLKYANADRCLPGHHYCVGKYVMPESGHGA